jgi:phosphatidate cytidylyltransferase
MKTRFITGLIMGLVGLPLLLINELFVVFELLLITFVAVGVFELFRMFGTRKKQSKWHFIASIIFAVLIYLSMIDLWGKGENTIANYLGIGFGAFPIIIILYTVVVMVGSVFDKNIDSIDTSNSFLTINYLAFGIASIMLLRLEGIKHIIYLLLVVMCTDVFAYLFGVKFGKHKMAPTISPKKSWEGAIAGTAFACLFGTLYGGLYGKLFNDPLNPTILDNLIDLGNTSYGLKILMLFGISLFGSICAQVGDLVASKLKRHYGIKDYSRMLPGHGGVLDRFDSTIFTAMILVALFSMIKFLMI